MKAPISSVSSRPEKAETIASPASKRAFTEVTIAAPGFRTYSQTRIDLASAQIKRIDVKLEVGDLATTVTVEGGTSQVETETRHALESQDRAGFRATAR